MTVKIGINGFGRIGRLVFRTIKQRAAPSLPARYGTDRSPG
jgi:glyceraldehyde-3-phosphate dehydrogenase/erythrose-4-phosphate dehydrogenase